MKRILKSVKKSNKICPECGSEKFYVPHTTGVYTSPIYIFHRTIENGYYKESSYINIAICCDNCGLLINGVEDKRTEVVWTETDITEFFIDNSERKNIHKIGKKIDKLIRGLSKENYNYIAQLKFSQVCIIFKGLLIDEDYKKILLYKTEK